MKISALTSSLPVPLPAAIEQLAELGFQWIDVPPSAAGSTVRQAIKERGLGITCVGLEKEPYQPWDLASADDHLRGESITLFKRAIEQTATLGASVGYLTPPKQTDHETRTRWTDSLLELANHASKSAVSVCVEHFPARLLPSARETLDFLAALDHSHLKLLIDVGHCLISDEDSASVVRQAGSRLGYIHFDDNNGQEDLHWALLDGCLTESQIQQTIAALRESGYSGGMCLELRATLDDPVGNLKRGKTLLEKY